MIGPHTLRIAVVGSAATAGFATAPGTAMAQANLVEAARNERSATWSIARIGGETAEKAGRASGARGPGVAVWMIRATGRVAHERMSPGPRNNAPQSGVFSDADVGRMPALERRNPLARYEPAVASRISAAVKDLKHPGYSSPPTSTPMMIVNTARLKPDDAPPSGNDPLDPKWRGRETGG